MSRLTRFLQKELSSERLDAVLICFASSILCILVSLFPMFSGRFFSSAVPSALIAFALTFAAAGIGIAKGRRWGAYLAASAFTLAALATALNIHKGAFRLSIPSLPALFGSIYYWSLVRSLKVEKLLTESPKRQESLAR